MERYNIQLLGDLENVIRQGITRPYIEIPDEMEDCPELAEGVTGRRALRLRSVPVKRDAILPPRGGRAGMWADFYKIFIPPGRIL